MEIVGNNDAAADEESEARVDHLLRRRVHLYLERSVLPKEGSISVLEIGCQGDNAVFLGSRDHRVLATHVSERALNAARARARTAELTQQVTFRVFDPRTGPTPSVGGPFDLVIADFGALNTFEPHQLKHLAVAATQWLRDDGRVVLLVKPPVCAREMVANLLCGRWRHAGRRSDAPVTHQGAPVARSRAWYYDPDVVRLAFSPAFSMRHIEPLGLLLPRSAHDGSAMRRRPVRSLLAAADRVGRILPGLSRYADHYLVDLERTSAITLVRRATLRGENRRPRFAPEPTGRVVTRSVAEGG